MPQTYPWCSLLVFTVSLILREASLFLLSCFINPRITFTCLYSHCNLTKPYYNDCHIALKLFYIMLCIFLTYQSQTKYFHLCIASIQHSVKFIIWTYCVIEWIIPYLIAQPLPRNVKWQMIRPWAFFFVRKFLKRAKL